jgi:cytochrome P450
MVSRILAWCPPRLRPIVKYIVPGYIGLRRQEARMQHLLAPIIEKRRATEAACRKDIPVDLLQWFMDGATRTDREDPTFLALSMINACLAAIHSTAIVATNAALDLATRPRLMDSLREELTALCDGDGELRLTMDLLKLPTLDSFLKESQRFHPFGLSKSPLFHKSSF